MKKNWKRLTAIVLCTAMIGSTGGFSAVAEGLDTAPQAIESVMDLSEDVQWQQVPYGTRKADLNLPSRLKVVVSEEEKASPSELRGGGKTITLSVKWEVNPDDSVQEKYDGRVPGIYVFDPVIKNSGYDAAGVNLPQIEVEVLERTGYNTTASPSVASASDGIYPDAATEDTWTGNGHGTVQVTDEGLHLKSTSGDNGNNQFYVVNDNAVISKTGTGFVEFTVKFNSSLENTRFGVYLFSGGPMKGQFVGYDTGSKWFWQAYSGENPYGSLGLAQAVAEESEVRIDYGDGKAQVTINGVTSGSELDLSRIAENHTKLAFKAAQWGTFSTDVVIKDIHYTGQLAHAASGIVTDTNGNAIKGAIINTDEGRSAVTQADGTFSGLKMSPGERTVTISAAGCITITKVVEMGEEDQDGFEFQLEMAPVTEIESSSMIVQLYENFPAVRQYTLKGGNLGGEVVQGSLDAASVIQINGKNMTLEQDQVTCETFGDKAVYTLSVPAGDGVAASRITVEITADGNVLAMEIPDVEYLEERTADNAIQSIRFPNQSLVSMSSSEQGTFAGSNMSSHTKISGDTFQDIADMAVGNKDWMYAFVSNGRVSAAIESNSEATGSVVYNYSIGGGSNNTRLTATTAEQQDGSKTTGLGSNVFYWNRVEHAKTGSGDPSDTMDYITDPTEKPLVKIILTGDRNKDGKADWQDGAIAFREISHEIYKSEEVPDVVAMRIVENFSSQATNPFLLTLDNAKKVYLNTDGLGQSILLKGYANEGHDSGHPDYYDINQRAGGAGDFKDMLAGGADIGAKFGIHVNASEMYPEAKAFDEDLVKRGRSGGLAYGWNWLDQGIGIDSRFDLVSGRREERFDKLHDILGGDEDQLDFIYVDVWGNGTGTLEDSWATRRLTDEITNNGWRMATEWGMGNEYDATFQHWAADLTYGDQRNKGYNSVIARFIRNHQKDSWVADYPEKFGGGANAPLLGGYNQKDFEGWAGRNNYDEYVTNLFTYDISTKFLQHFTVSQWELDPSNPKNFTVEGKDYKWIPDSMIRMDGGELGDITITRKSTVYSDAVDADYRDRTITLNGKDILRGHLTKADTGEKGDETYLIPWYWDSDGKELTDNDQKLYHWNTQGGESTWELPDGWEDLESVYVYRLTDQGRTDMTEVPVNGNQVTLEAETETPYVVYRGESAPLEVTWEGSHLYDTGFNSGALDAWNISGDAELYTTSYGNPVLRMAGASSADQTITDLVPGTRYALYLALDNRSDSDFIMAVTGKDGKELGSNRAGKSIAKNYVATDPHNANYGMEDGETGYTQNIYVWFTADDSTAVLHLDRIAGDGYTYIDNLRVVENEAENTRYNEEGDMISFTQDFEQTVQGLYPFVMGSATGVSDTRVHLSELHAPYTQAGWDVKKGSDVLDGNWSLKANGQTEKSRLVYQTVPQNLYFKPGYTYQVSFDYQVGSEGTYGVVIGNGEEFSVSDIQLLPHEADDEGNFITKTFEFEITGDADGQTWFGLYSTSTPADVHGLDPKEQDNEINFSGYKDLVLDNLKVERVDLTYETRESLEALIEQAEAAYQEHDYSPELWGKYRMALAQARAVLAKDVPATGSEITGAYNLLRAYMKALDHYEGLAADFDGADLSAEGMTAEAGSWQSGQGPELVLDGNLGTQWHTNWGESALNENNNWLMLKLDEPAVVDGVRYLPRAGGGNGNILKMEVQVSKDGSSWTAVTAKDGSSSFTFEKNDSWKKAAFQPQENVRFVKITALETDGNSAGEVNKFVSAREVRLTDSTLYTPDPLPADTAVLEYVIRQSEGFTGDYYTPETWQILTAKLEEAKAALVSNDYDAIALALANLNDAVAGLEVRPDVPDTVDKSELQSTVEEYSGLSQGNYTDESWRVFRNALSEARRVLGDEEATAAEVEKALIELRTAKANLTENPAVPEAVDKKALKSLVERCSAIAKGSYTDSSWNAFQEALAAAKKVLAEEAAGEKEVNEAIAALKAAEEGLTKKTESGSGGSSSSGSHTGSNTTVSYPSMNGTYPSAEASGEWKQNTPGSWTFKKEDGTSARNEWLKINGAWYLFGDKGTMLADWVQLNGTWYYLDPVNGDMKTGWQLIGGSWYYLNQESGAMAAGWIQSGDKWYYLEASGRMMASATTPDGYYVDENGAWVQ